MDTCKYLHYFSIKKLQLIFYISFIALFNLNSCSDMLQDTTVVKEELPAEIANEDHIYVKAGEAGNGTMNSPLGSIQAAIDMVVNNNLQKDILVCEGIYQQTNPLQIKNSVCLYGGYDANWDRDIDNNKTIINPDNTLTTVINFEAGITNTTILDGFEIRSPLDGSEEEVYTLYILNASPVIQNNRIIGVNNTSNNFNAVDSYMYTSIQFSVRILQQ